MTRRGKAEELQSTFAILQKFMCSYHAFYFAEGLASLAS